MSRVIGIPSSMTAQANNAAPTSYSAHSSGGTTVTSAGATDLDSTAAALATLVTELGVLTTAHNDLLAKLRSNNYLDR